ncbi:MAG: glycerol-3-phosphate dehydrogenase/oxidase [Actinomycetota bacterium]|nr:glycerol-3-phosphate dehydrogenase/oxidase [Actinomycetota bacterium]
MALLPESRAADLERLRNEEFDVVVIGGGITGAGALLEAVTRGYRAALVEAGDFASRTSSASSKLIHGGLRYLAQREIRLVYENLAERSILMRAAPSLVSPLEFVIPLPRRNGALDFSYATTYSMALWGYDLTGGFRIHRRHRRIGSADAKSMLPSLDASKVASAFVYPDAWCDDVRLVLAVIAAARRAGAVAVNYLSVEALADGADGKVRAVAAKGAYSGDDASTREGFEIRARAVINATGTAAAKFLDASSLSIRPAKGVHIALPQSALPAKTAAVLPVPGDNRTIFVLPWNDYTYVGTTDTDLGEEQVATTEKDITYLLEAASASLVAPLRREQVSGAWVGVRPLVADVDPSKPTPERTKDLSRRHRVITSDRGVISVVGGKLTTFRKMGADAIDALDRQAGRKTTSVSAKLPLDVNPGAVPASRQEATLFARYGSAAASTREFMESAGEEKISGSWRLSAGEIDYFVAREDALAVSDVLLRRLRVGILDAHAAMELAPMVASRLSERLGLSQQESDESLARFRADLERELPGSSALQGGR